MGKQYRARSVTTEHDVFSGIASFVFQLARKDISLGSQMNLFGFLNTIELQWLEYLCDQRHLGFFSIFYNLIVCVLIRTASVKWFTNNIPIYNKKFPWISLNICFLENFQGTQKTSSNQQ